MTSDFPIREDLAELQRRHSLTEDGAREEAVDKRRARGGRTARENVTDLVDGGSWVEYGRYVVAAQRQRLERSELHRRTPADGLLAGTATVNKVPTAVLAYDYMVLAGTQGARGHAKKDRLFDLIERMKIPVVFFAEGGGGRPNDTDIPVVSALETEAFALWARLSGHVVRISIVNGPCFAGNAVIAGCSDLIVATQSSSIGMGGPAMIAGGGLGTFTAEEVGPLSMQASNGVVDVAVSDETEAVTVTKKLLGYFSGVPAEWTAPDQRALRDAVPERDRVAFDVRPVLLSLADVDSVTELRSQFAPELTTALARIEGQPLGIIANNSAHMAGAVTAAASDKAARFAQLCDAFGLPIVSLVDTPGYMVGPEHEAGALVRHCSRLLVAGASLGVPTIAVIVRRAFGLGAQAMCFGSLHAPLLTVAWPGATLGAMGQEGAVRLAARKELEAIADVTQREERVRELTAMLADRSKALNAAEIFEIDDVIDPADTRRIIAFTLAAARPTRASGRTVDTW